MKLDKFGYISKEEKEKAKKILNSKDYKISESDKMDLATDLLNINMKSRSNIIEIATMLNMQTDDSYYIPYSLLIGYLGYQISKRYPDLSMTFGEKDEILDISKDLLKANISNKEFISKIYNDLRTGKDFDIMLSPRKIRKILEEKNNDNIKKEIYNKLFNKEKNM